MSNFNTKKIGQRLKKLRGNLTQNAFAKRIGSSLPAYQRYESGERLPKHDILFNIAKFCNVSIDWILLGDHEDVLEVSQPMKVGDKEVICEMKEYTSTTRHGMTPIARKIVASLVELDENDQRDILKHVEEKKLLNELLKKEKVSKAGKY